MTTSTTSTESATRSFERLPLACIGLGLFSAIFLSGFFGKGIDALGINALLFLLLLLQILKQTYPMQGPARRDLAWEIPLLLVILSYGLYETPFLRVCNFFAIPFGMYIFCLQRRAPNPTELFSSIGKFAIYIIQGVITPLVCIGTPIIILKDYILKSFRLIDARWARQLSSVASGITVLLLLSLVLVIPLLSSADGNFGALTSEMYESIGNIIEAIFGNEFAFRIVLFAATAILSLASVLSWGHIATAGEEPVRVQRDSISAGIVLCGLTIIYLTFLGVQANSLFATSLPADFSTAEGIVKRGFWQLIVLSGINVGLSMIYLRRTNKAVQQILFCFVIISLVLLFSAIQRMILYVSYYGLSPQKFYASYALLYCLLVFGILIARFHREVGFTISYSCVQLLFWMYGLISIAPAEQIIARYNFAVLNRPLSRVSYVDFELLGVDALPVVRRRARLLKKDPGNGRMPWADVDRWIAANEKIVQEKRWFQSTISSTGVRLKERGA